MSLFPMQFTNNLKNGIQDTSLYNRQINNKEVFDKDMNYYICSYGGSGSTVLFNYLSNFGNVYHIHDRYPPLNLSYVGNQNTNINTYDEWFNTVEIPQEKLKKYKVIFIYRNPIPVIFSRYAQNNAPNIPHLQHIKCVNNGNINLLNVISTGQDLYGIENFYDNYTLAKNRNYYIYAVKYELLWKNFSLFNKIIGIPDIKELYPKKVEHPKKYIFIKELTFIYSSLINKMNKMSFIEIIKPKESDNS